MIDFLRDVGIPEDIIRDVEAAELDVSLDHLTFGVMYGAHPPETSS